MSEKDTSTDNGSSGSDGGEPKMAEVYTREQTDNLKKNLTNINLRISQADNKVWLEKVRLGLILYYARTKLQRNFYSTIDENTISTKTVQRYTKMVLNTKSAELYGTKGTVFNSLETDKRLENLVGFDSSTDIFDKSSIDSSNHGTVFGPVTTKEKNDDGEEIEKTENGTIEINIADLTMDKITKMKKLSDKDFYKVVGGDDSPLNADLSGDDPVDELKQLKIDFLVYISDAELKVLLNEKRSGLLSTILSMVKDFKSKEAKEKEYINIVELLQFKVATLEKQLVSNPASGLSFPVISTDKISPNPDNLTSELGT